MSVIYVLLTISIIVALLFFIAFIVSVRNGQYDDSYTPSVRMLFEDELVKPSITTKQEKLLRDPNSYKGKQPVASKPTDRRATLAMTNTKIQLNKQK